MLDETQTEYYSLVGAWSATALCIPNTLSTEDAAFAGAVLECMAGHYSMDTVRKEYFDNVLDYQYVQDDASMETLDPICATRGCDIGQILLVGKSERHGAGIDDDAGRAPSAPPMRLWKPRRRRTSTGSMELFEKLV